MRTLEDAIKLADRVAAVTWTMAGGPAAFRWTDGLCIHSPTVLAQFVAATPDGSAKDLYEFAIAGEPTAADWADISRPLMVTLEVFRASFAALYRIVEADKAARVARLRLVLAKQVAADNDPLAELLDARMATDTGRPAKKGGRV